MLIYLKPFNMLIYLKPFWLNYGSILFTCISLGFTWINWYLWDLWVRLWFQYDHRYNHTLSRSHLDSIVIDMHIDPHSSFIMMSPNISLGSVLTPHWSLCPCLSFDSMWSLILLILFRLIYIWAWCWTDFIFINAFTWSLFLIWSPLWVKHMHNLWLMSEFYGDYYHE